MAEALGIGGLILSIIGTVLLWAFLICLTLLLFLLGLLAILLFVPIRYKVKLEYEKEKFYLAADISFLFRLLRAKITFLKKLDYRLKLLFFTLFSSDEKKKKKGKKKDGKEKERGEIIENKKEEKSSEEDEKERFISEEKKEQSSNRESQEKKEEKVEKEEKDFTEKIEEKVKKIKEFGKDIGEKANGLKDSYEGVMKKKDIVLRFFTSSGTMEGLELLFGESVRFLRAVFPKKIEGRVRFGTGDVYTEGKYLTYLCLLYGLYGDKLVIEPEWEEEVLEVNLNLRGKITLFTILRICIRVYFNNNFKRLRDNFDFMKTRLGFH